MQFTAQKKLKTKYYEEIEYWLEHFSTIHPIEYTKEDVDKKFRNIHSITVLPDTLYEENQVLLKRESIYSEHQI